MLVAHSFAEQPNNDPMLIETLQDSETDLEMTSSMRHQDYPNVDGNEFEQHVEVSYSF